MTAGTVPNMNDDLGTPAKVDVTAHSENPTKGVHFEEFKMFLDSAEKVTDRRLDLNKSNASLCLLITAGIGTIIGWSFDKPILPLTLLATTVISALAAAFCRWWWLQIEAYKALNSAKFKILNEMAPRVVFKEDVGKPVGSYEPFDREWKILQATNSLEQYKKGLALGSTWSELTIPKSFLFLYLIICSVSLLSFFARVSLVDMARQLVGLK